MTVTSMGPVTHVPITVATLLAAFVTTVGQVVAFVPSLQPYQAVAISAVSASLSIGALVANAIHAHKAPVVAVAPTVATSTTDALRAQVRNLGATPSV